MLHNDGFMISKSKIYLFNIQIAMPALRNFVQSRHAQLFVTSIQRMVNREFVIRLLI